MISLPVLLFIASRLSKPRLLTVRLLLFDRTRVMGANHFSLRASTVFLRDLRGFCFVGVASMARASPANCEEMLGLRALSSLPIPAAVCSEL